MAVLGRPLFSSAERIDLADLLSIDSYTGGDFKFLLKSLVGDETPYILKGFDVINPGEAIGSASVSIKVADSVVYYPSSDAGSFFFGLEEGNANSLPLVPELRKSATNYVYLTLTTFETAQDTRAFWDPDKDGGAGGEFTQDVNTESVLKVEVGVSTASFPEGTVPVAKITLDANFITSIEDARDMMFRLGTGGINPDPFGKYAFRQDPSAAYARQEPSGIMSSALDPNPFQGGDKNIETLKEWMDAIMTKLAELGGTTFWYEDTSAYGLINLFVDSLGSTLKSKGKWSHDTTISGKIEWTEDLQISSLRDNRDTIIRAGDKTLADQQVMYVDLVRGEDTNTNSLSLDWINGSTTVNGSLTAFENLSKGDWIKKSDDPDSYYVRVEEFYAGLNLGGGSTTPALALSIEVSETYAGITGNRKGVYQKGIYTTAEVQLGDRDNTALFDAGGNFYWLAYRSDVIQTVSDITTTTLSLDIANHNGTIADCTINGGGAHGLLDGQAITIPAGNFAGTYKVEVETTDKFVISVTGGPHADETAVDSHYAIVTTTSTSSNGTQLNSANHGLDDGDKVVISDTTNYDVAAPGVEVLVLTPTSYSIPVGSALANETSGTSTQVKLKVRSDAGSSISIVQGETINIGEIDGDAIKTFIGMSDTDTYPFYAVSASYNTLDGQANFNSDATDDLTERASKLTAMMADKAQDKTIEVLSDHTVITNTTNATAQEITFSGGSGTATVAMPSSQNNGTIGLGGTLSLDAGQAAYYTVDRNATFSIVDLTGLTVAAIEDIPVGENTYVFAYRLAGTTVWLWNGAELPVGTSLSLGALTDYVRQNKTVKMVKGGTWSWDLVSNGLTLSASAYIQVAGLAENVNEIAAQTITLAADGEVAYVTLKRTAGASTLTVNVADIASVPSDDHTFIVARRTGNDVVIGTSSFALKDGEFLELDGALAEINRHHGQLKITPRNPVDTRVIISGSNILKLDGSNISLEQKNLLLTFDGAQIDFNTGTIYEDDGTTPFLAGANDFTPFAIGSNEYFWYSVSVLPNTVNADNTISAQLLVLPAASSNATLGSAPKAPFPSTGIKLGNILVQEDGAGGILSIDYSNIIQLGVGGSGSGSGDANELLERLKNRVDVVDYDVVNAVIFSTIEEDATDGATTASYDITDSSYDFSAIGQNFTSIQMLDSVFLTEEKDVNDVELVSYWDIDSFDASATYEVSRDGGNEYQTVTMERIGNSDTVFGRHVFAEEASFSEVIEQATTDVTAPMTDTVERRGQAFTVASQMTIKKLFVRGAVVGYTTMKGNLTVQIVKDNAGSPSEATADIIAESNLIDLSSFVANGNVDIEVDLTAPVPAGTYHIVYKTDAEYRANWASAITEFSLRADSTPAVQSTEYAASAWGASAVGEIMYRLEARLLDLRVRITSGTADVNLFGFGIFYDIEDASAVVTEGYDREVFIFSGDEDKTSFAISEFTPDKILLTAYELETGQAYRRGAWTLNGTTIEFPAGTFDKPGETITVEFLQVFKGSMQFDASNRQLLQNNNLGSTIPALDFSSNGRGIYLRRPDGTLRELTINNDDKVEIFSV